MDAILSDAELRIKGAEVQALVGAPRCAWLREGWALEGLDPPDPRYVQALLLDALDRTPTSTELFQARQMARDLSLCGLFWEAVARRCAMHMPLLWKFYGPRSLVGVEQTLAATSGFARKVGAWVDATIWTGTRPFPREGDAVIIGNDTSAWARGTAVYQHLLMVALWEGGLLHGLDGGQPGIRIRTRGLVEVPKARELWAGDVDRATGRIPLDATGRPLKGRRVLGWIDVSRVPYLTPPRCLGGEDEATAYGDERPTGR